MKKGFCVLAVFFLLLLTGCRENELENDAFPLAMGIAAEETGYHLYLAYPDLDDKDASENALAEDAFWDGTAAALSEGLEQMEEGSSRNADLNHVKAVILDQEMLDGAERAGELISFLKENREISWNAYVFLAGTGMDEIFSEEAQTGVCLGIYLENLAEGWDDLRSGSLVTVGDLVSQYYNETQKLLIPVVEIQEDLPTVETFALTERLLVGGTCTRDAVFASCDSLVIYTGGE
ncbi:MAG: hypothetical protein LUE90_08965 [Clostridiales bacterium]|nr:hypothetical protein [Clostridiales bacterium]